MRQTPCDRPQFPYPLVKGLEGKGRDGESVSKMGIRRGRVEEGVLVEWVKRIWELIDAHSTSES